MTGQWLPPGTLVSTTKITDHQDITEVLMKVALITITLFFLTSTKSYFYVNYYSIVKNKFFLATTNF